MYEQKQLAFRAFDATVATSELIVNLNIDKRKLAAPVSMAMEVTLQLTLSISGQIPTKGLTSTDQS